eukprot:jgi/Mesen1/10155/ME000076S09661
MRSGSSVPKNNQSQVAGAPIPFFDEEQYGDDDEMYSLAGQPGESRAPSRGDLAWPESQVLQSLANIQYPQATKARPRRNKADLASKPKFSIKHAKASEDDLLQNQYEARQMQPFHTCEEEDILDDDGDSDESVEQQDALVRVHQEAPGGTTGSASTLGPEASSGAPGTSRSAFTLGAEASSGAPGGFFTQREDDDGLSMVPGDDLTEQAADVFGTGTSGGRSIGRAGVYAGNSEMAGLASAGQAFERQAVEAYYVPPADDQVHAPAEQQQQQLALRPRQTIAERFRSDLAARPAPPEEQGEPLRLMSHGYAVRSFQDALRSAMQQEKQLLAHLAKARQSGSYLEDREEPRLARPYLHAGCVETPTLVDSRTPQAKSLNPRPQSPT